MTSDLLTTASVPRSWLSVPGSSERMIVKAATLPADAIVLDLEDAVTPGEKDAARTRVIAALAGPLAGRSAAVRVNGVGTPWCHLDLIALAQCPAPPRAIVVPKVESAADLVFADRLLAGVAPIGGLRLHALIESAGGLLRLGEIAAASPRTEALILGYADLGASLGRSALGRDELDGWRYAQEAVLTAARAHELLAVDGPHLGIEVDDGFQAAVARARDAGFDGKWAVHPRQLQTLNAAFTPTAQELERAHAVLAALDAGHDAQRGAVALNGTMLDEAVRVWAQGVVDRGQRAC